MERSEKEERNEAIPVGEEMLFGYFFRASSRSFPKATTGPLLYPNRGTSGSVSQAGYLFLYLSFYFFAQKEKERKKKEDESKKRNIRKRAS